MRFFFCPNHNIIKIMLLWKQIINGSYKLWLDGWGKCEYREINTPEQLWISVRVLVCFKETVFFFFCYADKAKITRHRFLLQCGCVSTLLKISLPRAVSVGNTNLFSITALASHARRTQILCILMARAHADTNVCTRARAGA